MAAVNAIVTVKAGKRTYTVSKLADGSPLTLPSDSPTAAEKAACGAAALAAVIATKGAGYSSTDAEPDWAGAVAQSVMWEKSANL
jgi:hypothetical protein